MKMRAPAPFMLVAITVILVGVLTIIELPCPICHGQGVLVGAQGLKVESVECELISVKEVPTPGCEPGEFMLYFTYAVNMLMTNEGTEPSQGCVLVAFYRDSGSQQIEDEEGEEDATPLRRIPVYVEVPAETTKNVECILSFERPPQFKAESHWAAVKLGGQIPCPQCGTEGKLPFVEWLQEILQ